MSYEYSTNYIARMSNSYAGTIHRVQKASNIEANITQTSVAAVNVPTKLKR